MSSARIAIGASVLLVAAAVAVGLASTSGNEEAAGSEFGSADAPAAPAGPEPRIQRYEVGGRPDAISAGAGYAWVTDSATGSLTRINPASKRPIPVELAGFPTDVSADPEAAWVALGDGGSIQRVTGTEGAQPPIDVEGFPFRISAGEGAVWPMSEAGFERVETSGKVVETFGEDGGLSAIAAGEGSVWVVQDGEVVANALSDSSTTPVDGPEKVVSVATGESAAWALSAKGGGRLHRIEPSGEEAGDPVLVELPVDVAAGLGYVWVLSDRAVTRYDPETGAAAAPPVPVGAKPAAISVGEGSAWVAVRGDGAVVRITP